MSEVTYLNGSASWLSSILINMGLFLFSILILTGNASGSVVDVSNDFSSLQLNSHMQYTKTYLPAPTADEVLTYSDASWRQLDDVFLSSTYSDAIFWLKFQLNHVSQKHLVLDVEAPLFNAIELYHTNDSGELIQLAPGDKIHQGYQFYLPDNEQGNQTILLRVEGNWSFYLPITLWDYQEFNRHLASHENIKGMYTGIWCAVLLINLFVYVLFRPVQSLSFGGLMLFAGPFFFAPLGLLNEWIPSTSNQVFVYLGSLAVGFFFLNLLVSQLLDLKNQIPAGLRLLQVHMTVLLLSAFLTLFLNTQLMSVILGLIVISSIFAVIALCMMQFFRKVKTAGYVLISLSFMLYASLAISLAQVGLLEPGPLSHSISVNGFLFMCISLGMTLLIKLMEVQAASKNPRGLSWAAQLRTNLLETRVEELKQDNDTLREFNTTDALTGVRNRRYFDMNFDQEWRRASREKYPLSLVLLDIDHFKKINDEYGHLVGDDCLRQVSSELNQLVKRPGDILARYGGEEFVAILPHVTRANAVKMADEVRQRVNDLVISAGREVIKVSLSAGVCTLVPSDDMDAMNLISLADGALYEAKRNGRNQVCCADIQIKGEKSDE